MHRLHDHAHMHAQIHTMHRHRRYQYRCMQTTTARRTTKAMRRDNCQVLKALRDDGVDEAEALGLSVLSGVSAKACISSTSVDATLWLLVVVALTGETLGTSRCSLRLLSILRCACRFRLLLRLGLSESVFANWRFKPAPTGLAVACCSLIEGSGLAGGAFFFPFFRFG